VNSSPCLEGLSVLLFVGLRRYRPEENIMLEYKVVEVNTVSEECLEEVLNEWTAKGWRFDGMQFAMRESSRRPSMAFVLFTREVHEEGKV
jgi:hypothetical protein